MSASVTVRVILAVGGGLSCSAVALTTMPLVFGPVRAAANAIAGVGGCTGGGTSSPAAALAFATASSVVASLASNNADQADLSCRSEPLNCSAESGTTCCAPSESVKLIGEEPSTLTGAAAIAKFRSRCRFRPRTSSRPARHAPVTAASPPPYLAAPAGDSRDRTWPDTEAKRTKKRGPVITGR